MHKVPLKRAIAVATFFAAVLWTIHISAAALGFPVDGFGIRPGELTSLHGVLTAPLAHASFEHLISNTLPMLVLGTAMLYGFPRASRIALPLIWLASGLGVWLFARAGTHLGASGLTHGIMFFVFVMGVLRRDRLSMALAMIVFFLYGGMVWGVFPTEPRVSFESHLFGAIAGVVSAFLLRRRDPLPPRRRYEWEKEPALEEDDPVIGDLWRDADAPEVPTRRPNDDR